jgi:hypothetical protein
MRHFKLSSLADINAAVFSDIVQQAVKLNSPKVIPQKVDLPSIRIHP